MAAKRTIRELDVEDRTLLVRVDFNVPLAEDGAVADDRRIRSALPTLEHALERGAALVLMSHLGRPKGAGEERLRMDRVAARLRELLGDAPVTKCDEVVGDEARRRANDLGAGEVLVLENLRFHPGEKQGDEALGHQLAQLADAYVNDAFATCHRSHASMVAAARAFPEAQRAIGFLVERELEALRRLRESPPEPLVLLLGGVKVEDKVGVIETLAPRAEAVLVGGACAYPLLAARGHAIGDAQVEDALRDVSRRIVEKTGEKLVLPVDHVVACGDDGEPRETENADIPAGCEGRDIGPRTIERFTHALEGAGTVVWSGPLGRFEDEPFERGTRRVAEALARAQALTVVGGGETAEAVERFGVADRLAHVSTGGGAFLAFVETGTLPALEPIPDR